MLENDGRIRNNIELLGLADTGGGWEDLIWSGLQYSKNEIVV